ncbi:FAD-dependent oxidoreductase [Candidatus Gracilibacteria bacterium]|nr:FAD-dependent oxidoreductase [Candidatus Gracilibacteria bacterium]
MSNYDYDIAVVGSGSGGLTVAFGLSAAGKNVVMIEKGLLGGDCTNFGCVPSKALIDISKTSPGIGLKAGLKQVRARRKLIQDEETVEKIESHGPKVLQGFASFVDEHTLKIKGDKTKKITAEKIILSTGSRACECPVEGIDPKHTLNNETIFEQKSDIKNLVIIGGGYIGCELAESISDLGTNVTLIQRNDALIAREEQESSKLLQGIFKKKGIKVHTGAYIKSADKAEIIITDKDGKKEKKIAYDKVLVALGRRANIEKLGLKNAGIDADEKGIIVDKYNRTSKKHIFSIGDCVSGNPQFTHWANNEGRGVIRNILVPIHNSSVRNAALPAVLYTHKEVARVGKTETEIKQKYSDEEYVSKIMYFDKNDRSKVTDDTTGFVKINFKRLTGKILGATIFGTGAGEMLPILTAAIDNNISAYRLASTIQPYPTKSDMIKRVLDTYVVGTLGNIKNELKFFLKNNALQIATALIWLAIIAAFFSYKSAAGLSFEQMALTLYNFLGGSLWGPILYILIYTVRPVVLFPGVLMTFMSGALFGFVPGLIYTVFGATFSALFAHFLGGVFGKKLLSDEGGGIIDTLRKQTSDSPFMSTLMTRLLFFPYDLTNYACGFLKVPWKPFAIATFVGIIPGSAVFILAGAAFHNETLTSFSDALSGIDTSLLIWAAILFVATLGFAKLLKKLQK